MVDTNLLNSKLLDEIPYLIVRKDSEERNRFHEINHKVLVPNLPFL